MTILYKPIKVNNISEEYKIAQQTECCNRKLAYPDDFRMQMVSGDDSNPKDILTFVCPICKGKHEFQFDIGSFFHLDPAEATPEEKDEFYKMTGLWIW